MGTTSADLNELPRELLAHVLLSVDEPQSILSACPNVCKLWYNVCSDDEFWKNKCRFDKRVLPPPVAGHVHDYRSIYQKQPFGRNLVKNPNGDQGASGWQYYYGTSERVWDLNGFIVERPPSGVDDPMFDRCFATSFYWCMKTQTIRLESEGCTAAVMDEVKPTIAVREWHAHRADCGSVYTFRVELRDESFEHVLAAEEAECSRRQSAGGKWEKVEWVFRDYPKGVRYVHLISRGKDTHYWAGHYGPKMAGTAVELSF